MQDLALTVAESSQRTRIGKNAIYKAIQDGELPAIRIGRRVIVPVRNLEAWLERKVAEPSEAAGE